ncbi:MAG: methylated-DNA--[protein]-cysteine S-methyltransferase [Rubrobacter sp.]|nr:methylated-DNA--[protein]-cysteine S-methyltransferase [Rubrobacter sp.]
MKARRAYLDTADSPAGKVAFAVDEAGAFIRLRFEEGDYETGMEESLESTGYILAKDPDKTAKARAELLEYAVGERKKFDTPLATTGSAWQREVWIALTRIPFGETRTYSEVAAACGRGTSAARAVGNANAANRLPLVVPCHRLVGSDGSLTGFAGGVHLKERLLVHEARFAGKPSIRGG